MTNRNTVLQNLLETNIKCVHLSGILTLPHRRDHCDAIRHGWGPRCRDRRGGSRAKGLLTPAPRRPRAGLRFTDFPLQPRAARNGTDRAHCLPLRGAVHRYISQVF